MTLHRLILLSLLFFGSCTVPDLEEPVVIAPDSTNSRIAESETAECAPGEGDGIGGTGCEID